MYRIQDGADRSSDQVVFTSSRELEPALHLESVNSLRAASALPSPGRCATKVLTRTSPVVSTASIRPIRALIRERLRSRDIMVQLESLSDIDLGRPSRLRLWISLIHSTITSPSSGVAPHSSGPEILNRKGTTARYRAQPVRGRSGRAFDKVIGGPQQHQGIHTPVRRTRIPIPAPTAQKVQGRKGYRGPKRRPGVSRQQ